MEMAKVDHREFHWSPPGSELGERRFCLSLLLLLLYYYIIIIIIMEYICPGPSPLNAIVYSAVSTCSPPFSSCYYYGYYCYYYCYY